MSHLSLPPRPSLEQLKKQAKELLGAHKSSDPEVCSRLRDSLPRLSKSSDAQVLKAKVSLRDAQLVIAREYGFENWRELKRHVESTEEGPPIEVTVHKVLVSRKASQRVIVLLAKDRDRCVPIWIGPNEADSIAYVLKGMEIPRPLTHDLLDSTIEDLGASVKQVLISHLKDDTFYATIVLNRNGATVERDSRPSDAIALAVRSKAPIYVAEKVAEKAGVDTDPDSGVPLFTKGPFKSESAASLLELYSETGPAPLEEWEPVGLPEELSDAVRKAVSISREEARRLGHSDVGTEHLLLGLLRVLETRAFGNISYEKIDFGIQLTTGRGDASDSEVVDLTPGARESIRLAAEEAKRQNHETVEVGHLVVGLLQENEGVAARILQALNVDLNAIRRSLEHQHSAKA